jgi:hypothetical protein
MKQSLAQGRSRSRKKAPSSRWPRPPATGSWRRPTFGEFLEQLEHEFGADVDTSSLLLTGLGPNERLAPSDIKALCAQLGVPAEDFGVGP